MDENPLEAFEQARGRIAEALDGARAALAASEAARAEAEERMLAVRFVLSSALACRRWYGLDRRAFARIVADARAGVPAEGPKAVWREVIDVESRKVVEGAA